MIDEAQLNDLAAKAEAATPGERTWAIIDHGPFGETEFLGLKAGHNSIIGEHRGALMVNREDAAFVAAADPETILALVAEVKRFRAARVKIANLKTPDEAIEHHQQHGVSMNNHVAINEALDSVLGLLDGASSEEPK